MIVRFREHKFYVNKSDKLKRLEVVKWIFVTAIHSISFVLIITWNHFFSQILMGRTWWRKNQLVFYPSHTLTSARAIRIKTFSNCLHILWIFGDKSNEKMKQHVQYTLNGRHILAISESFTMTCSSHLYFRLLHQSVWQFQMFFRRLMTQVTLIARFYE